jgi:hypothetical protein
MYSSKESGMHKRRIFIIGLILTAMVCLTLIFLELDGIGTFAPSPTITLTAPVVVLPLTDIDEIHIHYHWLGMSPASPTDAEYSLKQTGEQFAGHVIIQVGITEDEEAICIPSAIVERIVQQTSQMRMARETYVPFINVTDNYPHYTIQLMSRGQVQAQFYSSSQGVTHAPWKVTVNGVDYVEYAGVSWQVMELMKPYLKWDVLEHLQRTAHYPVFPTETPEVSQ